jgi:hypothetical protein
MLPQLCHPLFLMSVTGRSGDAFSCAFRIASGKKANAAEERLIQAIHRVEPEFERDYKVCLPVRSLSTNTSHSPD